MDWPTGQYAAILADPPWSYEVWSAKGKGRTAEHHYSTMTLADIMALPVASLALPDCALFLWATYPNLPQAFEVMQAWGFRYSTVAFTWAKRTPTGHAWHLGLGHWTRSNAEVCLLGLRGSPRRQAKDVPQLLVAPVREHSRKPDETHERIMRLVPGSYLELFARARYPGWDAWGAETGKFSWVQPTLAALA